MKNQHLLKFAAHLRDQLNEFELDDLKNALGHSRFNSLMEGQDDWDKEEIGIVAEALDEFPQDILLQHRVGWSNTTLEELSALIAPDGLEIGVVAHAA